MSLITPRTLKGFRDLMPEVARRRADLVRSLEDTFRQHGYAPIDTPALEYAEILKGKGGEDTDKELFEWTDKGGREVALRFDLTVPLARFVAQHHGQLVLPFRRYAMGPVWRGERPQRGRFREFWQCDADVIGPVSDEADAEILILMLDAYEALDIGEVVLRVNDRRVLQGILSAHDAGGETAIVLRALDKRDRQGDDAVRRELAAAGLSPAASDALLEATKASETDDATFDALDQAVGDSALGQQGVAALRRVFGLVAAARGKTDGLRVDPSIARGLDYYTGIVFEAQLTALPAIGSVGSGGRYDDLAGLYTKTRLPGVGCSVGIDRLLAALTELGQEGTCGAPAVLVANPGADQLPGAFSLAAQLRRLGLACEVYPEHRKHGQQMRYADRRRIPVVLTIDPDGSLFAKRLADGETQKGADLDSLLSFVRAGSPQS